MALLSLPPEILDKICQLFCSHCQTESLSHFPHKQALVTPCPSQIWEHDSEGVKALVNLSETCQALNTFALSHLYHRVSSKSGVIDHLRFPVYSPDYRTDALKNVRSLSLAYTREITHLNNQLLGRRKRGITFNDMVKLMPRIQLLHITLSFERKINIPESTTLESLRYLHIEGPDIIGGRAEPCNLEFADLFQQAPKIDTLIIQAGILSWSSRSTGLGNVKCLKMVNTFVSQRDLSFLVDSCPRLESFIFFNSKAPSPLPYLGADRVILETLPQVLSLRQNTLRYLEVYWGPYPSGTSIMSSLKDLTNLETFIFGGQDFPFKDDKKRIPLRSCLVDLLPPSIHSVTIESKYQNLYEPMCALAEATRNGSFPNLKEVRQYNFGMKLGFTLAIMQTLGNGPFRLDNDPYRDLEGLRRRNFDGKGTSCMAGC
ncbi:uncharacterized protein BKA55DRAFT_720079 [Fusarium redolens]|uniref:F-box domain-containing protein n=1 Tax=Fusarium redolens TaxID=48865 RepID=A0A9P9FVP9_FUSRE|nr:uncharacterized protein BKA55DRAFT_720079 [Fusarium redolens]KAH7210707.1 hypothetical protein BKA55DRAFT_720079 [Fusarium redolens]